MTPVDLQILVGALLAAGAIGTVIVVAFLSRRVLFRQEGRLRVLVVVLAVPALMLGWAFSRQDLAIMSAYGEALRSTPVPSSTGAILAVPGRRRPRDRAPDGRNSVPVGRSG